MSVSKQGSKRACEEGEDKDPAYTAPSAKHARGSAAPSISVALYIDKERGEQSKYKDGIYTQLRRCLDDSMFTLDFITNDQIEKDYLALGKDGQGHSFSVLCFPGGSVFSQETSLSDAAVRIIWAFVSNGGGVLGICAGALLLGAEGYSGCKPGRCMLGAETLYLPVKGTVQIQLTSQFGKAVFGKELSEVILTMPFSHGACFKPDHSKCNRLTGQPLSACYPLAHFVSIQNTDDTDNSTSTSTPTTTSTDTATVSRASPLGDAEKLTNFFPMVLSMIGKGRVIAIGPHPESLRACPLARRLIQPAVQFLARTQRR
jgi:hypothetical protein